MQPSILIGGISFILISGIACGVAYWGCPIGRGYWRMVPGFALAIICGWLGGTFILAGIASLVGEDGGAVVRTYMGRGFWIAIFGAWYGVFRARRRLAAKIDAGELASQALNKRDEEFTNAPRTPNIQDGFSPVTVRQAQPEFANTDPTGNIQSVSPRSIADEEQVYAQIAKEIESGMVDQGLWTRLLAQTDGDEKRTKVLYIKQRAERMFAHQATPTPTPTPAPARNVQVAKTGNGQCIDCGSLDIRAGAYEKGKSYQCNDCGRLMH